MAALISWYVWYKIRKQLTRFGCVLQSRLAKLITFFCQQNSLFACKVWFWSCGRKLGGDKNEAEFVLGPTSKLGNVYQFVLSKPSDGIFCSRLRLRNLVRSDLLCRRSSLSSCAATPLSLLSRLLTSTYFQPSDRINRVEDWN